MQKINTWVADYWRLCAIIIGGLLILIAFLFIHLGTTPNGFSPAEFTIHNNLINHTYTFSYIWHNVMYAPYNIGLLIIQLFGWHGLIAIRSIGAIFGVISAAIFFYIIWRWYGTLIATLSSLIFVDSLWFLQTSRNRTEISAYIIATMLIMVFGFIVRSKRTGTVKTLLAGLATILLLYIPGMIWFVFILAILQRKIIKYEVKKLPGYLKPILPLLVLFLLTPMIYAMAHNNALVKTFFGLPDHFSMHLFLENLWHWPLIIFVRTPLLNIFSLGHQPILPIFTDVMVVLGLYWAWLNRKLDRVILLSSATVIAWLLYSVNGPVPIIVSLPFIACFAASGMYFYLAQWFKVFPRNPVARLLGISLLSLAVLSVAIFQANQYFIAWPNTPIAKATYSLHE